jgi:DNA-binding beta-propeller fold protein YncE
MKNWNYIYFKKTPFVFSCLYNLIISIVLFAGFTSALAQNVQFQFIRSIGKKGILQGEFNAPQGIAVDISGKLYIADTGNNRIQLFSPDGKVLKVYGGFGKGVAQYDEPVSLWAGNGLYVCIADKNNHRIVILDGALNYVTHIDGTVSSNQKVSFHFPLSVACSSLGEIFVLDSENNRIVRYSSAGVPMNSFGGYDTAGPPLKQPKKIVISESRTFFISDAGQKAVIMYDYFGNYRGIIGQKIISQPAGLLVTEKGIIFICDGIEKHIAVVDTANHLLGTVEYPGFKTPIDAAFYNSMLYVLDKDNNMVLIFKVEDNKF